MFSLLQTVSVLSVVLTLASTSTIGNWQSSLGNDTDFGTLDNATADSLNVSIVGLPTRPISFTTSEYNYDCNVATNVRTDQISQYADMATVLYNFKKLWDAAYPTLSDEAVVEGGSVGVCYSGDSRFEMDFAETDFYKWWNKAAWHAAINLLERYLAAGPGRPYSNKVVQSVMINPKTPKISKSTLVWRWQVERSQQQDLNLGGNYRLTGKLFTSLNHPRLSRPSIYACIDKAIQWASGHPATAPVGDLVQYFSCKVRTSGAPPSTVEPKVTFKIYSGQPVFPTTGTLTYGYLVGLLRAFMTYERNLPANFRDTEFNYQIVDPQVNGRLELTRGNWVYSWLGGSDAPNTTALAAINDDDGEDNDSVPEGTGMSNSSLPTVS